MAYTHGKFVWFEHVSHDVSGARRFYDTLFGWNSDGVPVGGSTYHMIMNGADGIGGYRQAMPGAPNHWLGYLSVADVDTTAARAQAAGARVLMPPTDFGPVGRAATLADPTGGVFAIWKGAEGDRPEAPQVAAGDWTWNELMTTDTAAALAFYEGVFGFSRQPWDMGAQGIYYILNHGDKPRAGLMATPKPESGSFWIPYVAVAACDASMNKAKELGAEVVVPPTDIPDVGRIAAFVDPTGAVLGILQAARRS